MIKYIDLNLMDNVDNIEYLYSEKCKLYNIINILLYIIALYSPLKISAYVTGTGSERHLNKS